MLTKRRHDIDVEKRKGVGCLLIGWSEKIGHKYLRLRIKKKLVSSIRT